MFTQLIIFLPSIALGIMLFFSFVVAPITFKSLNEESARVFIRKIFPYYYNVNLTICSIATLCFIFIKNYSLNFYLILSTTILFGISSFILMPLINKIK